MTQNVQATTSASKPNVFTNYPPIIPMVVITVSLVAMAQFGSTEKLAAAFAWLIFVAILMTDGIAAFQNLSKIMTGQLGLTNQNATGGTSPAGNILP